MLAGCNGILGGGPQERAPYEVSERFPPGIDEEGVVDTRALLANHTDELQGRSVTVRRHHTQRFVLNDTLRYRTRTTDRVGRAGNYYTIRQRDGAERAGTGLDNRRIEGWSNGSVAVLKVAVNNTTDYRPGWPLQKGQPTRYNTLFLLLSDLKPTLVGEGSLDARSVYVLRATRDQMSISLPTSLDARTASNVSFVAWVERDGLIRGYELMYEVSVENTTVRVTQSLRFEAIGSTRVPRPPWVDTAIKAVDIGIHAEHDVHPIVNHGRR